MRIPAIYASMLRERAICAGLFGAAIILVTANIYGLSIWPCSFHAMTGKPCPACGLTRGMSALVHGDVARAVGWNAFTPAFAFAAALMLVTNLLPSAPRLRLVAWVDRVERRTGIVVILMAIFVIYGVWRMFAYPHWP